MASPWDLDDEEEMPEALTPRSTAVPADGDTKYIAVSAKTYELLQRQKQSRASSATPGSEAHPPQKGDSDEGVILRSLRAMETLSIIKRALVDARKAAAAAKKMREAQFSQDKTVALCRALFGEQSEKDMRKAFKHFDKNGDGKLDKDDIRDAVQLMGENGSIIEELMKLVDSNNSGHVDFEEFVTLVHGLNPKGEVAADNPFASFRNLGFGTDGAAAAVATVSDWGDVFSPSSNSMFSAISTAWSANLEGLSPLELRKAGVMLENMKRRGYSQEKAQAVVSAVLCDQSKANIKKAFRFFDEDHSGQLDLHELKEALPLMGENVPPKRVNDLLKKIDRDGTGHVDLDEFVFLVRGMNPKDGKSADSYFGQWSVGWGE